MAKKVTETIEIGSDWYYRLTLKEAVTKLCELANQYGDDAVIYSDCYGYDGPEEFFVQYERDETEDERQERLRSAREEREKKNKLKIAREESERKEFDRLKKKFG